MKILIINSVCGIRSTGKICADLAKKYISAGHECVIAYGRGLPSEDCKDISYRIGNDRSLMFNVARARILDNEGLNSLRQTKTFLEWASKFDPDIVWLHNIHGYYINYELLFNWIKQRPFVEVKWTLHDCWAFTGHCTHFEFVGCEQWKCGCTHCVQKGEYPKGLFVSHCISNYKRKKNAFCNVNNMTIISPSQWLAKKIGQSFLSGYPVQVVNNEIDRDIFKPTASDFRNKYDLTDKKLILGVASAWNERKGILDFIQLAKRLEDPFRIVLVGLTRRQMKAMPPNIVGIGRTSSPKELAEIYSAADIFLNLTYDDTYPTVNLEAQACGISCITYRTGGSVESVEPQNVVDRGDIEALILKLRQI